MLEMVVSAKETRERGYIIMTVVVLFAFSPCRCSRRRLTKSIRRHGCASSGLAQVGGRVFGQGTGVVAGRRRTVGLVIGVVVVVVAVVVVVVVAVMIAARAPSVYRQTSLGTFRRPLVVLGAGGTIHGYEGPCAVSEEWNFLRMALSGGVA